MRRFVLLLLALLLTPILAFAEIEIPPYVNFVTDTSGIISDSVEAGLNEKLKNYAAETGTEIAVLTVPLVPDGLFANEYATAVGNAWGVGKAKVDNGALLLIETDDVPGQREIYIATGSQLEGGLTDVEATDIVDYVIIPHFRDGDFDGGVSAGVDSIISALAGEVFDGAALGGSDPAGSDVAGLIPMLVFLVGFIITIVVVQIRLDHKEALKYRLPAMLIGPGGEVVLGLLGGSGVGIMIPFAVIAFFFSLMLGAKPGTGGGGRHSSGGSSFGSSRSSGGSSSGGFGGFSGGGFSGGGGGSKW
jgi:uncharacterized protein